MGLIYMTSRCPLQAELFNYLIILFFFSENNGFSGSLHTTGGVWISVFMILVYFTFKTQASNLFLLFLLFLPFIYDHISYLFILFMGFAKILQISGMLYFSMNSCNIEF